jgi:hypothetical protein
VKVAGATEWANWVEVFERSGQNLKAFCYEKGESFQRAAPLVPAA